MSFFRPYSIIFDGTPHIGDLLGVIARYLDDDWTVRQELLGVVHASKALDHDQLAVLIDKIITKDLQLNFQDCYGTMRDAASVNGAVLDGLSALLPNNTNITCFSHMWNRVGSALYGPLLNAFKGAWAQHFGHSNNAVTDFRRQFGLSPSNPSSNRWYYWVDQYVVMLTAIRHGFADWLRSRDQLPTVVEMHRILTSGETQTRFQLELTTICEVGKLLSAICYELEGDGNLIFKTYELFRRGQGYLAEDARLPQPVIDVCAYMAADADGALDNARYAEYENYCRSLLAPARVYLVEQVAKATVASSLHVAKMAAMWHPLKARGMSLNSQMMRVLFTFFLPVPSLKTSSRNFFSATRRAS